MSDAIKMLDAAIQDVDSDIRSDMEDAEETGEHVEVGRYEVALMYYDAQAIRATVIEQQAEIERLRGIVRELIEMLDYDRTSERYRVAVDAAYSEIDQ